MVVVVLYFSVAILIYHIERQSLLFVRQFRPGKYTLH